MEPDSYFDKILTRVHNLEIEQHCSKIQLIRLSAGRDPSFSGSLNYNPSCIPVDNGEILQGFWFISQ